MRLWEIIDNAARARPDTTALATEGRQHTFSDLATQANRQAVGLAEVTRPGERVAVVSENSAAYVAAFYGVPRAGA
ncbi:MAG: AMP-binding protein, partial [Microthrixaceae bacterium]